MSTQHPYGDLANKYPIHEETMECYRLMRTVPLPKDVTLEQHREIVISVVRSMKPDPFDGNMFELTAPSPHSASGIPITVYKPTSRPATPTILIFFHEGGLAVGSRAVADFFLRKLSSKSGAIIACVGYRLLPNPSEPLAPFDDGLAATKWLLKNKEALGGVAASKMGIGGDSSGAQIALSVTNELPGALDFQVLNYPVTDWVCNRPSHFEFGKTPLFNTIMMEKFFKLYLHDIPDAIHNPRFNPSARTNLKTCPPTLILQAQLDPIRDWGVEFSERLKEEGVDTRLVMMEGVPHSFLSFPAVFKTNSAKACEHIATFIKSKL